jgi:heterodisulfide reductase subunit B
MMNIRDNKLIYDNANSETLTRYNVTINEYCDYLKKSDYIGTIGKLEKFKIDSILEKLGEETVDENIMNKLEKIDKHVTDFVSIKRNE